MSSFLERTPCSDLLLEEGLGYRSYVMKTWTVGMRSRVEIGKRRTMRSPDDIFKI